MTEIQVRTECDSSHTLAISWRWENMDGVQAVCRPDAPPPTLVIEVAQLDECSRERRRSTGEGPM